jgi:hypothetical protein
MKALNNSKTSRGLFCQLFDGELNKYVMQIADEFFQRNPEARQKPRIAVEKHGLQSDGKTWVLNETCQIDGDGNQLDETESTYIWMEDYLSSRSVQMFRSEVVVPLKKKSFSSLLKKLHSAVPGMNIILYQNFPISLQFKGQFTFERLDSRRIPNRSRKKSSATPKIRALL